MQVSASYRTSVEGAIAALTSALALFLGAEAVALVAAVGAVYVAFHQSETTHAFG